MAAPELCPSGVSGQWHCHSPAGDTAIPGNTELGHQASERVSWGDMGSTTTETLSWPVPSLWVGLTSSSSGMRGRGRLSQAFCPCPWREPQGQRWQSTKRKSIEFWGAAVHILKSKAWAKQPETANDTLATAPGHRLVYSTWLTVWLWKCAQVLGKPPGAQSTTLEAPFSPRAECVGDVVLTS